MFRRLLRQQIRAVAAGKDPRGVNAMNGSAIPTYLRNTAFVVEPKRNPAEDRKLWLELARKVADEAIADRESRWKEKITTMPYEGVKSEFSG
jgi:hypothetical protein